MTVNDDQLVAVILVDDALRDPYTECIAVSGENEYTAGFQYPVDLIHPRGMLLFIQVGKYGNGVSNIEG